MLKTRILTAIVLVILLLVVLFGMPKGAAIGFFAALVLAGAWEWCAFAGIDEQHWRLSYVVVVAGLCAWAWDHTGKRDEMALAMSLVSVWWLFALVWLAVFPSRINRVTAGLAGLPVLVPAWAGLARIYDKVEHGAEYVLFVLMLVWAADIGAYFAGRTWGRHKLAPRVSPGKTWEGVAGGVLLGTGMAAIGAWWFHAPALNFVLLGAVVVAVSVVGDLTESLFKRFAGLKDSGSVLPGHGGILDRIDSLTAAVPVFALGLCWLGKWP
jgi:phosphatidate cytidylyltransferase